GGLLGQTIIDGGHIKTDEVFITNKLQIGDLVIDTNSVIDNAITDFESAEDRTHVSISVSDSYNNVLVFNLTATASNILIIWFAFRDFLLASDGGILMRLRNVTDGENIREWLTLELPLLGQVHLIQYTPPSPGNKVIRLQCYGGSGNWIQYPQLIGAAVHK